MDISWSCPFIHIRHNRRFSKSYVFSPTGNTAFGFVRGGSFAESAGGRGRLICNDTNARCIWMYLQCQQRGGNVYNIHASIKVYEAAQPTSASPTFPLSCSALRIALAVGTGRPNLYRWTHFYHHMIFSVTTPNPNLLVPYLARACQ